MTNKIYKIPPMKTNSIEIKDTSNAELTELDICEFMDCNSECDDCYYNTVDKPRYMNMKLIFELPGDISETKVKGTIYK